MPKKLQTDGLSYTQSMLRELREMALAERNTLLAYIIEMAYIEASDQIRAQYQSGLSSAPCATHEKIPA